MGTYLISLHDVSMSHANIEFRLHETLLLLGYNKVRYLHDLKTEIRLFGLPKILSPFSYCTTFDVGKCAWS